MKKILSLIIALMFAVTLTGCSGKQDSFKFVKEDGTQPNMQSVDYEVNIGNNVGSAKIVAEVWQDGVCTESTPVTLNKETEELHILFSVDGFEAEEGDKGVNVQIDTNGQSESEVTYFELPSKAMGYSFTSYGENEVIEANAETEAILAAMAFDTGEGVATLDCETLANSQDKIASYSCLLVIRSSFAAEEE